MGKKMRKAHLLHGCANPPDSRGIASKLVLRVDDTDLHSRESARRRLRGYATARIDRTAAAAKRSAEARYCKAERVAGSPTDHGRQPMR